MSEALSWAGKTVLVTGASSGIGREVAVTFAARGATVFVVARRAEPLKLLIEDLGGDPHAAFVCDISDLAQVRDLAELVAERAGHLDVLVNNAGVRSAGPLSMATSEGMEQVIRTNLLGPIYCTRELLPLLRAAPVGRRTPAVVTVASIAGRIAIPRSADYTASKFGVVGLTEALWHDLPAVGIRVMMINPGPVDTEGFPMTRVKAIPGLAWAVMDPPRVARALVRGIERGAYEVRVQWWFHPVYSATVLAGPARRRIAARLAREIPLDF
ncbi:MAG TPA: SDR family oxidoreductase [Actinomycetota bacterium]|nr:SDR family oxidoreductase [Actinomycetota bacterium]